MSPRGAAANVEEAIASVVSLNTSSLDSVGIVLVLSEKCFRNIH